MRFRITNIVAIVLLVALVSASYYHRMPWWGYVLLVVVYVSVVVWGCINISSQFFLPVLCRANTNDKVVALTFDDGPHPALTAQILDTLKQHNAPATFFCIGKNIKGHEDLVHRMRDEGHIIGNHSYCHDFWFDMFGSGKMLGDMWHMDREIIGTVALKLALFRPPYGVTNPNIKKAAHKGKYTPIGWSIRSMDTVAKDKQKLLSRITGQMKAGDIILLHDTMEITRAMLPELIEEIRSKGFRIVPLDKMLNVKAYA